MPALPGRPARWSFEIAPCPPQPCWPPGRSAPHRSSAVPRTWLSVYESSPVSIMLVEEDTLSHVSLVSKGVQPRCVQQRLRELQGHQTGQADGGMPGQCTPPAGSPLQTRPGGWQPRSVPSRGLGGCHRRAPLPPPWEARSCPACSAHAGMTVVTAMTETYPTPIFACSRITYTNLPPRTPHKILVCLAIHNAASLCHLMAPCHKS